LGSFGATEFGELLGVELTIEALVGTTGLDIVELANLVGKGCCIPVWDLPLVAFDITLMLTMASSHAAGTA
jgi:hypothetical protein